MDQRMNHTVQDAGCQSHHGRGEQRADERLDILLTILQDVTNTQLVKDAHHDIEDDVGENHAVDSKIQYPEHKRQNTNVQHQSDQRVLHWNPDVADALKHRVRDGGKCVEHNHRRTDQHHVNCHRVIP